MSSDPAQQVPQKPDLHAREPKAIHRALRVLEAVASIGPGATAKAVSKTLDYPTATTYRLLNLLVQDGYLVRMHDLKGFALGRKVSALAGYVEPARTPQAVRELLEELRSHVRAGVHLVQIRNNRCVLAEADPLFPPSADSSPVSSAALEQLAPTGGVAAATEPDGRESLAVGIRDDSNQLVACVVLTAPAGGHQPGDRERALLETYADQLTRLLV